MHGETLQLAGTLLAIAIEEWESPGGVSMWIAYREDDEIWYVLEGKLIVRIGTEDLVLEAGGAAIAPRGVARNYRNSGPERVRYLLVMPEIGTSAALDRSNSYDATGRNLDARAVPRL